MAQPTAEIGKKIVTRRRVAQAAFYPDFEDIAFQHQAMSGGLARGRIRNQVSRGSAPSNDGRASTLGNNTAQSGIPMQKPPGLASPGCPRAVGPQVLVLIVDC